MYSKPYLLQMVHLYGWLGLESQFGYKMAKFVCGMELIESFSHIGKGKDGYRYDVLGCFKTAGI